jgi:hypothetical protein
MTDLQSVALPLGEGAGNLRAHISEHSLRGQSLPMGRAGRLNTKPKAAALMLEPINAYPTVLILPVLPLPDQTYGSCHYLSRGILSFRHGR